MRNTIICLSQFPTHIAYRENKKAPNKYIKINSQSIYNGRLSRFDRNTAMKNIHRYISDCIPKNLKIRDFPIKVTYNIRTVINHGDISRRNGNIIWKYPKEGYIPTYDLDNLSTIWIKAFQDTLVHNKVIPEDSVHYLTNFEVDFGIVDHLDDREIIIQINKKMTPNSIVKLKECSCGFKHTHFNSDPTSPVGYRCPKCNGVKIKLIT